MIFFNECRSSMRCLEISLRGFVFRYQKCCSLNKLKCLDIIYILRDIILHAKLPHNLCRYVNILLH